MGAQLQYASLLPGGRGTHIRCALEVRALALGHLVLRRHRLLVVQAVELRVPAPRHEGVADLVARLGREAAALEALRAHLALDELATVLALRHVDVHRVEVAPHLLIITID